MKKKNLLERIIFWFYWKPLPIKKQHQIKTAIRYALADNKVEYKNLQLHSIKMFKHKNKYRMEIAMGRPGIFIGVQGKTYDAIKTIIQERLNGSLDIDITEYSPWDN